MRAALGLARRGLGRVAPNPAVGCVLVKGGAAVARGWTGDGGHPHAEEAALGRAGVSARGATAYVTLEPCAHRSCARKLAEAGVARVVVACGDPDPRTAGRGLDILRDAGVEVARGVCAAEAQALNRGFILRVTQGRPLVTLKTATSLDGCVALANGRSQWITGARARARGHLERARHDAVLVGIGTALADDPALTTRLPGVAHDPARIVLDTYLRLPEGARLAAPGTWLLHAGDPGGRARALEARGVRLLRGPMDIPSILGALAREGLTRVLVEGGPAVLTSFLEAGLWDRLLWFRAGAVMGGDARGAVGPLGLEAMGAVPRLARESIEALGPDVLEVLRPAFVGSRERPKRPTRPHRGGALDSRLLRWRSQ